ncbi:MAG: hypothetical protein K8U03_11260 [Planctomycetia bacterium]|nr:hypothetical protein [Planctomycetia bacterium]
MSRQDRRPYLIRNDGAHRDAAGGVELREAPAELLPLGNPQVLEKFEELDDLVFDAIAGRSQAVEQLRKAWPEALALVGPALVEESRDAYLQHALNKWLDCTEGGTAPSPKLAVTLMDVLTVLMAYQPE